MFGSFNSNETDKMKQEIIDLKRRITDVESYNIICESEHQNHKEFRRSTDNKIEGVYETLVDIRDIAQKFLDALPTIRRSQNTYTTIDALKSCGLWVGAVCGGFAAIYTLFNMFS